ncbi:uncharacterized protein [Nicotiana tomentosiformis]|uniref:uncharacterized protein n=1 Tax=Nicotiana tomentosiformis TaxID=4098 RepID=UPI00388CB8E0
MAPKKKVRTSQRANVTPGVTVDPIIDDAGEHPRSENIPPVTTVPDSTTTDQTAPAPTLTEGATIPPTDIPVPPPIPASDSGVSEVDLRGAMQMLAQIVASQAQRLNVAPTSSSQPGDSTSSRVNRFLQLDLPVFTGTNPEEDPQDVNDEMHKTLRVMCATEMKAVELAFYRLKKVAYSRFELWEESREEISPPAKCNGFADAFIDHFLPAETKAAHATEFENLRQGSPSVWDYHMRFACLSKYVIYMLPTMDAIVRRFVQGLSPLVINEAAITALNSDMNYGKMVAFTQAIDTRKLRNRMEREGSNMARSTGNFGGSTGGGRSSFRGGLLGPSQSFAQSSASAPPSGPSQKQQWSSFRPSKGNMGSNQQGHPGGRFQQ